MVKTRSRFTCGLTAVILAVTLVARGAGVTIITHGLNGNTDGWVTGIASQIPNYTTFPGSSYTLYKLYFIPVGGGSNQLTWLRIAGSSPSSTDSGEIIVALDWSQFADGYSSWDTYQIAAPVASVLQSTGFISELNGHALCELPLHLIGHSRGGSLMSEISLRLGTNGVWVDHLTTLDPHPLNNDGFDLDWLAGYWAVDAPVHTYQNVLFHDNYWQNLASVVYGEPVAGAYVRQLYNLSGGYRNIGDSHYPHSNVHLWYHGTVDERNPANDTEALITTGEFMTWYVPYENWGLSGGFKWSLIGRGNRTSSDQPVGPGYPAIRDGYNQTWDLGAGQTGNRTSLPSNNGTWPNVMKFNLVSTNQAPQGTSISVNYFYQWAQPSASTASLSFYLDDDFNPLNPNSHLLQQVSVPGNGASYVSYQTLNLSLNATNAPVGNHVLYAKITGGGHTRYLYAPELLTVTPPPDTAPPVVAITDPATAKTYTSPQTVTISATATDNVAVASVAFYDGSTLKGTGTTPPYTYDWSFTAADNGPHVWTARAYGAAGNVSTSSAVALTISIAIRPPAIAISNPANGANLTSAAVTVSGTASVPGPPSSGLKLVQVRLNGGSWSNATGTANWSSTATLLPCGNTIEARAQDAAGNYSSIVSNFVTYTPPNTPPNPPSNVSPAAGASNVSTTPTLQASAFSDPDPPCLGDTHAASQWQVLTPGAVVVADSGTDTVNKLSWKVPASTLYYGSNYQWRVRYRDSRNGWSSYSSPTFFTNGGPLLTGARRGPRIVLNWPTNTTGFTLQWSTNLASAIWSNATPPPVIVNGQNAVTNNFTNRSTFYRLKK